MATVPGRSTLRPSRQAEDAAGPAGARCPAAVSGQTTPTPPRRSADVDGAPILLDDSLEKLVDFAESTPPAVGPPTGESPPPSAPAADGATAPQPAVGTAAAGGLPTQPAVGTAAAGGSSLPSVPDLLAIGARVLQEIGETERQLKAAGGPSLPSVQDFLAMGARVLQEIGEKERQLKEVIAQAEHQFLVAFNSQAEQLADQLRLHQEAYNAQIQQHKDIIASYATDAQRAREAALVFASIFSGC